MSISYLKENLGINAFGLLFPNDAYGIGFSRVSCHDAPEVNSFMTLFVLNQDFAYIPHDVIF